MIHLEIIRRKDASRLWIMFRHALLLYLCFPLAWTNPKYSYADDVILYHIYSSSALGGDFQLIQTINGATNTTFIHSGLPSIAGCYYATAVDSNLNESSPPDFACVDTCFVYNI